MILDRLDIDADAFHGRHRLGDQAGGRVQGRGVRPARADAGFDLAAAADRLGMALVHDDEHGAVGVGAVVVGVAGRSSPPRHPSSSLDDLDGNEFHLSSLRGQKVLLVAWAPY